MTIAISDTPKSQPSRSSYLQELCKRAHHNPVRQGKNIVSRPSNCGSPSIYRKIDPAQTHDQMNQGEEGIPVGKKSYRRVLMLFINVAHTQKFKGARASNVFFLPDGVRRGATTILHGNLVQRTSLEPQSLPSSPYGIGTGE